MKNTGAAILLVVVRMATVSVILLIMIYLGKLLITLVDKYAPEEVVSVRWETSQDPALVPGNILAVVTAAVDVVTQGRGKIIRVEKL